MSDQTAHRACTWQRRGQMRPSLAVFSWQAQTTNRMSLQLILIKIIILASRQRKLAERVRPGPTEDGGRMRMFHTSCFRFVCIAVTGSFIFSTMPGFVAIATLKPEHWALGKKREENLRMKRKLSREETKTGKLKKNKQTTEFSDGNKD